MNEPLSAVFIALVCVSTLLVGAIGLRFSRRTSDFYVAGRSVTPRLNASAIGGEYLSAASFLGVAGLVYQRGAQMLWLPVGYTLGFLVLLTLVAAPMRRSRAYTLPDFAEFRLGSRGVRSIASLLVVAIGWLYLVPQLQGASLTLSLVTGAPGWVGGFVVAVVVGLAVGAGGMRSITLSQAFQYWLKLTALAVPAFVLLAFWFRDGSGMPPMSDAWLAPLSVGGDDHPLYRTYSTIFVLSLGTMGLPHVIVRYYTNPNGDAARRTTVAVIALLGLFYVFPPVFGVLGRVYLPELPVGADADSVVLRLPGVAVGGSLGHLLTAVLAGGAFAAFLSTASGLAMAITGVLDRELLQPRLARVAGGDVSWLSGFRLAVVLAVAIPFVMSRLLAPLGLAATVGLAFGLAAASLAPLLILGVWWPRLSRVGAIGGLTVGAVSALGASAVNVVAGPLGGWPGALLAQPGAWAMPLAFAVAVVLSLATPSSIPADTARIMGRLHTPERLALEPPVPRSTATSDERV